MLPALGWLQRRVPSGLRCLKIVSESHPLVSSSESYRRGRKLNETAYPRETLQKVSSMITHQLGAFLYSFDISMCKSRITTVAKLLGFWSLRWNIECSCLVIIIMRLICQHYASTRFFMYQIWRRRGSEERPVGRLLKLEILSLEGCTTGWSFRVWVFWNERCILLTLFCVLQKLRTSAIRRNPIILRWNPGAYRNLEINISRLISWRGWSPGFCTEETWILNHSLYP